MEAKDMYVPSPYPPTKPPKAFGKKPLAVRRGGSIPIISTFEQVLGIKTILMGFGLESNAIHSPNENIPLDIFRKGIEAVVEFYLNYK